MTDLWNAVVADKPEAATPAFFPEQAYLQLKSIPDASGDFENRLMQDFALDIGAAHEALGPGGAGASLVGVEVPAQYAHWVPPGECDNTVGYFEVANSRVVYQEGGETRSFGIASMISWRGAWYVVHLGAILRDSDVGIVLDPESGPGVSAPSNTC